MRDDPPDAAGAPNLGKRVEQRFGVLPNFFRLAPETPEITEKLWGFAQVAYLDNPLPSVFKERLFVHLSRFCAVRYCIARHVGFLVGLGRAAGDPAVPAQNVIDVVKLLQRPFPRGQDLQTRLSLSSRCPAPLSEMPLADTEVEDVIFVLAAHVFVKTSDYLPCLDALARLFGSVRLQYLFLFLAFVRAAHYWTEIHPEIEFEDDINKLLATHETLAQCILNDPEVRDNVSQSILDELPSLRLKTAELRDLSVRIMESQDAERRRIARELHDSAGQTLAALSMRLGQLARDAENRPAQFARGIEDAHVLVERLSKEIRTTSYLLHPPLLEETGLSSALTWYVQGLRERSDLDIRLTIPPGFERVPADAELVIFRIVQESLTNVHRHSGSKTASIRISREDDRIIVEVQDQGHGVPPEKLAKIQSQGTGLGIAGMRERLRPFKGELLVESNATGTKILATLPLKPFSATAQAVAGSGS